MRKLISNLKTIGKYLLDNPSLIGYILIALSIAYAACKIAYAVCEIAYAIDANF